MVLHVELSIDLRIVAEDTVDYDIVRTGRSGEPENTVVSEFNLEVLDDDGMVTYTIHRAVSDMTLQKTAIALMDIYAIILTHIIAILVSILGLEVSQSIESTGCVPTCPRSLIHWLMPLRPFIVNCTNLDTRVLYSQITALGGLCEGRVVSWMVSYSCTSGRVYKVL